MFFPLILFILKRSIVITNFALPKNNNLLPNPASNPIGQPFIVLSSVDSTNNYAMAQVQAGTAAHGTVYFTHEQTAGKGQRGKSWLTTSHENVMLSTVIQPRLLPGDQFLLSASIALACHDFYKNYAPEETTIKWPNDLYWRDRKAGGILIENNFRGRDWLYAIAGIGININQTQFDAAINNPVSLKQITGKDFDVIALSKELCNKIEQRYQSIVSEPGQHILQEYTQVMYKLHQKVRLKRENIVFETTIEGVSPTGRLLTRDVIDRQFDFGEVEWVM
jgi:BirA family biotin operon repressor/biotin-[acetyl-CoA-carboxylase] ligase